MDLTNYIYFTIFYFYLGKNMSLSFTRSVTFPDPASLSEVSAFAEFHVSDYAADDGESPLTAMCNFLAAYLPLTNGRVRGVQALAYREGAIAPIVWRSERVIEGSRAVASNSLLPSFLTVSYSASTNTYRRNGPRFSIPVVDEAFVTGNTLTDDFDESVMGKDYAVSGGGFMERLNDDSGWDSAFGSATTRTVVKRVPNLAPEGSGEGDRLPSFITDPVSAVFSNPYTYNPRVRSQLNRRF